MEISKIIIIKLINLINVLKSKSGAIEGDDGALIVKPTRVWRDLCLTQKNTRYDNF